MKSVYFFILILMFVCIKDQGFCNKYHPKKHEITPKKHHKKTHIPPFAEKAAHTLLT